MPFYSICHIVFSMPIIKSAKKALRGSKSKRVFNLRRLRTMKENTQQVQTSVQEKKIKEARESLSKAHKSIDKAAKRGVIKKNNANRKKSKLSKLVQSIS